MRPVILTIAGSDSSGGAGIQADLKAIEANGGFGASAITAITVQNTLGVQRVHALPADLVGEQVEAVLSDLAVAAVKSGMLVDGEVVCRVAAALRARPPSHFVLDPVLRSTSGVALLDPSAVEDLVRELMPLATLLTPNVDEAQRLAGGEIHDVEGATRAGRRLLDSGAAAVLVKGGHLDHSAGVDVLVTPTTSRTYVGEWIDTPNTHGTGCIYSAAIATWLARGLDLERAVARSKEYVTRAIAHGLKPGAGNGPADPFFRLRDQEETTGIEGASDAMRVP